MTFKGDAIVNPANERCLGGGGLDGAISSAGGGSLAEARRELPEVTPGVRCPTGNAVITISGDLADTTPIKFVIHAVGPIFARDASEHILSDKPENMKARDLVEQAVINSLHVAAAEPKIRRIAFPIISGGIFANGRRSDAIYAVMDAFDKTLRPGSPMYGRFDEVVLYAFSADELKDIKRVYNS